MQMCESQPWCHTKGALQAILRCSWEWKSSSYAGHCTGAQLARPCQCARASHGAIPRGALKATLRRFPGLEVKLLCQALNECSAGHAMPMCASQPWCYTKGALRATLRRFPGVEVKLLCHANVREPAMVPYQGGSASNIEAFPRSGSQALVPCQCARASHGAIPRGLSEQH